MKCEYESTLEEMIRREQEIPDGFIALIKTYGFPTEFMMGYYYTDGEVGSFPVPIIMIHFYQFGNLLLKDNLPHLVCDGALTKVEVASLISLKALATTPG